MKSEIRYFANNLTMFSKGLKKKSILVNKPWVIVESDFIFEKMLFKKNKELIISDKGNAIIGKWDYHPEIKSLLIETNGDKILLQELYIDEAVLIFIKGSLDNNLVVLVNEKIIPDLDVFEYLRKLKITKTEVLYKKLINGDRLEIEVKNGGVHPLIGDTVSINKSDVPDGLYYSEYEEYRIVDNRISQLSFYKFYKLQNGDTAKIRQKSIGYFEVGDTMSINNLPVSDGLYVLMNNDHIIVKESTIVGLKIKYGIF